MFDSRELLATATAQTCEAVGKTASLNCTATPEPFDVQEVSTIIFLEVAVIILVCRFVGLVFKYLALPSVIGEIIAGILLGPSGMGQAHPDTDPAHPSEENPTNILFPLHERRGPSNTRNYLNVLAQLGVVVFMFVVGLEVDIPKLKKTSSMAAVIAICSVALPFVLGAFWLAPDLHKRHYEICPRGAAPGSASCTAVGLLPFQLFVGVSMSVTAFPVLARIITEKGLQKLQLGSTTLACAALNDVVAWALLTICLAVNSGGGYTSVPKMIGLIIAVGVGEWLIVGPLMRITALNHFKRVGHLSPNRLAWIMVGMLLSAWLVHVVGFHAMLGAFLFGLVFPRGHGTPFLYTILQRVEAFATILLLPIFFLVTGLSIDLTRLKGQAGLDFIYIFLTACAGKFFGSCIPAKLYRMNWRHTMGLGVMMNTRGLTEVVVLNIAKDAQIIDEDMFTALVLMAVITTAMAGPLLSVVFPAKQLVIEKQLDILAAAASKGKTIDASVARIVVLVHNVSKHNKLLEAAVSTLTSPYLKAHLDIAQFLRPSNVHAPTELGTGNLYSPEEVGNRKALREGVGRIRRKYLTSTVTVRVTDDTLGETQMHIRGAVPQLVVTDWPASEEERQQLKTIVVESPCTVVLWGGYSPTANTSTALPAGATGPAPSARTSAEFDPSTRPASRRPSAPPAEADNRAGLLAAQAAAADAAGARGASERTSAPPSLPTIASQKELTHFDASSNGHGNGAHGPATPDGAERLPRASFEAVAVKADGGTPGGATDPESQPAAADRRASRRQWSVGKIPRQESRLIALRKLLLDDKYQDDVAEAVVEDMMALAQIVREKLGVKAPEEGEEHERERDKVAKEAAELMGQTLQSPVATAAQAKTVTAESMAVAAASALSPKFSKLMVCGWPAGEAECAELVRFLYDVEHDVKRRTVERQRTMLPSSVTGESRGSSQREGTAEMLALEAADASVLPPSKVVLMMNAAHPAGEGEQPQQGGEGAALVAPSGDSASAGPGGPLRSRSFVLGANQTLHAAEAPLDVTMGGAMTLSALHPDGGIMTTARLGLVVPAHHARMPSDDLSSSADDVCLNLDNTLTPDAGKALAEQLKANMAKQETIPE